MNTLKKSVLAVVLACVAATLTAPLSASADTAAQTDDALVNTYSEDNGLVAEPTVVCDVKDEKTFLSLTSGGSRPSNAIFNFDANKNAVASNGEVLGSFSDVYASLNHEIIPVVFVADEAAANAFIDFLDNDIRILDIAVMSDNDGLVKKVRAAQPRIRGIVEYKSLPADLYTVVKQSTEAQATVVALQQKDADFRTVNYLQARFKTVWVRADNYSFADYYQCINGGASGVIDADFDSVYGTFSGYNGFVRNIFNVAHRGLPSVYNENSLGGIRGAMLAGATHLELDGHLTKDKRIVLNHDDTIDSATNGFGVINDMTLEEIKSYDLVLKTPHEKIPTLEEAIDLIDMLNEELGAGVVLVFEIKDDSPDFVRYLKEVLDEKDFYDSIVIITFESNEHQLAALKELTPQIPTATLDAVSQGSFQRDLPVLNGKNAGVDLIRSLYNEEYAKMLRDRGFSGWYWTFTVPAEIAEAAQTGHLGVTNNAADCYKEQIRFLYGTDIKDATAETVPAEGAEIPLTAELYDGTKREVEGKVYYVEATREGWRCFAEYTGDGRTVYTQQINYLLPVPETFPWWIPVVISGAVFAAAGAAAGVWVIIIKCKKKKS